jgi:hypothetical protein
MTRSLASGLLAALVATAIGCTQGTPNQVLTGKVTTSDAVAVRAISGTDIITAGRVHSDGSFKLELPAGKQYRLEVLTSGGVARPILEHEGAAAKNLAFQVCHASTPYDMGGVGGGMGSGSGSGGMCPPPTPPCDSTMDPNCPTPCDATMDPNCPPPPPPCDPTDPMCCDPTTMTNCPPPPPPPPQCNPNTDPMCPCDPMTDPNCVPTPPPPPPPCMGPNCQCDPSTNTMCVPPCDPTQDPTCATPPPPCMDPMNPNTCQDPCMNDPSTCGCGAVMGSGSGSSSGGMPGGMGGTCWPPPDPQCDSMGNCPCDAVFPQHAPTDFGCQGSTGT